MAGVLDRCCLDVPVPSSGPSRSCLRVLGGNTLYTIEGEAASELLKSIRLSCTDAPPGFCIPVCHTDCMRKGGKHCAQVERGASQA